MVHGIYDQVRLPYHIHWELGNYLHYRLVHYIFNKHHFIYIFFEIVLLFPIE